MVKLSDFINTQNSTPLQDYTAAAQTVVQGADESLKGEAQAVAVQISNASSEKARARSDAMQAIQANAQEQFQLNNIFGQLQQTNINTVKTLSALDEENRIRHETATASSWLLDQSSKLKLGFDAFWEKAKSEALPDGSDLLPKYQQFINQTFADAEASAPNALAVAHYKKLEAQSLAEYGGRVLQDTDKIRTANIINNTQEAVNGFTMQLRNDPNSTDPFAFLEGVKSTLDAQQMDPLVRQNALKAFAGQMVQGQIDGFVNNADFDSAYKLIGNKDTLQVLNGKELDQTIDQVAKAQKSLLEYQVKEDSRTQDIIRFQQGQVPFNPTSQTMDNIGEYANNKTLSILGSNLDDGSKATQIAQLFQSGKVMPEKSAELLGNLIQSGTPKQQALIAQVIGGFDATLETNHFNDKLSANDKKKALIINQKLMIMDAESAIRQATDIIAKPLYKEDAPQLKEFKDMLKEYSDSDVYSDISKRSSIGIMFSSTPTDVARVHAERDGIASDYLNQGFTPDLAVAQANKDVAAMYSESTINNRDGFFHKTRRDIMSPAPEAVFSDDKSIEYFTKAYEQRVNKIAANMNATVDFGNRMFIQKLPDGSQVETPFKIGPTGSTYNQAKNGSAVTSWQISEDGPGVYNQIFDIMSLDSTPVSKTTELEADRAKRFLAFQQSKVDNHVKLIKDSIKSSLFSQSSTAQIASVAIAGVNKL